MRQDQTNRKHSCNLTIVITVQLDSIVYSHKVLNSLFFISDATLFHFSDDHREGLPKSGIPDSTYDTLATLYMTSFFSSFVGLKENLQLLLM